MKNMFLSLTALAALSVLVIGFACGGGSSSDSGDNAPMMWTWMSGGDIINQPGEYHFLFSVPGARSNSISWVDSTGDLWLFGGYGYDESGNEGDLNDLWQFDGTYWAWMLGGHAANQPGYYGTMGSPDEANTPGARSNSISWNDNVGDLWLFGGSGYGSGGYGYLNDLWQFDGTYWTWMSGSDVENQPGYYGTMGSPGAANVPGARNSSVSWIDNAGDLWLFGGFGYGYDESDGIGLLNDLWRFDGTYWTWMSGSDSRNQLGYYGTMGSPGATNVPGARYGSNSWTDSAGDLWLFGGRGFIGSGFAGFLNDLWRFDGTYWTWMSGSDAIDQLGYYGTMGSPGASNVPDSRFRSVSWTDSADNLWLFGGNGPDGSGGGGYLNTLWRFDGTYWTWMSGSDALDQPGYYGTMGSPGASNVPGARENSISWTDSAGDLWLFGGNGFDESGNEGKLNDLWRFGR